MYRNSFEAFYSICKKEGLRGIQRGLIPGMFYQTSMNGMRLGLFEPLQKLFGATNPDDPTYVFRNISAGATSGVIIGPPSVSSKISPCLGVLGAISGSPFFLVKARLQAASSGPQQINAQYKYSGMVGS